MHKLRFREAKPSSSHPLALFYYCDMAVSHQMEQLNNLMRTTPDNLGQRSRLIAELKESQHNMVTILQHITLQLVPAAEREALDFRAKYSDEVQLDQINGPIWFGAECLTAGSHIANHEEESADLRPSAITLCNSIRRVRDSLRKECSSAHPHYTPKLLQQLKSFDTNWAEFEYKYVSLMSSVKSKMQLYQLQDVAILFSETTHRALKKGYLNIDNIEMMDPSVMFAIPRLAIVCGLAVYPDGPINPDRKPEEIPRCFRAYRQLLLRVRELMGYLSEDDLTTLETALCSAQGLGSLKSVKKTVSSASSNTSVSSVSTEHTSSKVPKDQMHRSCVASTAESSKHVSTTPVDQTRHTATDEVCSSVPEASWFFTLSQAQRRRAGDRSSGLKRLLSDSSLPTSTSMSLSPSCKQSEDHFPSVSFSTPQQSYRHHHTGPAGFASTNDLLHRLFVVISGIADKLQSNYAEDMRAIMKMVFELVLSEPISSDKEQDQSCVSDDLSSSISSSTGTLLTDQDLDLSLGDLATAHSPSKSPHAGNKSCSVCHKSFSVTLRRHHCKFCGQVVCRHCSPHSLPNHKSTKFLRACDRCFLHELSRETQTVSSTTPFSAYAFS